MPARPTRLRIVTFEAVSAAIRKAALPADRVIVDGMVDEIENGVRQWLMNLAARSAAEELSRPIAKPEGSPAGKQTSWAFVVEHRSRQDADHLYEVVAQANNVSVARAAFVQAVKSYQRERIVLRNGIRIIGYALDGELIDGTAEERALLAK